MPLHLPTPEEDIDLDRWARELWVKLSERVGNMDGSSNVKTAHRHFYYFEEMKRGRWLADKHEQCYVLWTCSEHLRMPR